MGYIYTGEKNDVWKIRTSPAHLVVQHTNHWTTGHVKIVNRSYIYTYTTFTNFSMKYLVICKVYTDVGGIK